MKDTYIAALLDLFSTTDNVDDVLRGFEATLQARGHQALRVPVLQGVHRVLEAKRPTTQVTVKNEAQRKELANAIASTLTSLGAPIDAAVTYDDTIIGGHIVEHNHQRIDASFKTKLVDLYRSITS